MGSTEHTYYYTDGKLRREQRDGTNIDYFYDVSGNSYAFRYQGDYYYVTNLQGDVVGIVNQSGNQIVGYTYDAWGNVLTTTGSSAGSLGKCNSLRYRDYYDRSIWRCNS